MPAATRALAVVGGTASAIAVDRLGSRLTSPLRELAATAAYAGVTVAALRSGSTTGRRIAAAGWASHAVFDAVHDTGPESRLPSWYDALCAGYDVAVAALLLRPVPSTGSSASA